MVLVSCKTVINGYQQDSRVLYKFESHKDFVFPKIFNSKFSYNEVWFVNKKSELLEVEDCFLCYFVISLLFRTFVINYSVKYKKNARYSDQP